MNTLNLPDFDIIEVKEANNDYLIISNYIPELSVCPHCGIVKPHLRRFCTKDQLFLDLPIHARRVGIRVVRQRCQCQECDRAFLEWLPHMDTKHLMTRRLVAHIERESLKRTFVSVAEEVGIDEGTVRYIFREYIERLEDEFEFETPAWMGIDEVKLECTPKVVPS